MTYSIPNFEPGEKNLLKNYNVLGGGFPGSSAVKNPPTNAGDTGSILGSGRSPGEGNDKPLQYSSLRNGHGQRNLAGNSPWGYKELDTK